MFTFNLELMHSVVRFWAPIGFCCGYFVFKLLWVNLSSNFGSFLVAFWLTFGTLGPFSMHIFVAFLSNFWIFCWSNFLFAPFRSNLGPFWYVFSLSLFCCLFVLSLFLFYAFSIFVPSRWVSFWLVYVIQFQLLFPLWTYFVLQKLFVCPINPPFYVNLYVSF